MNFQKRKVINSEPWNSENKSKRARIELNFVDEYEKLEYEADREKCYNCCFFISEVIFKIILAFLFFKMIETAIY